MFILIGVAIAAAIPLITKFAKKEGATGSKDKLSVDQAVNFVNGYNLQLDQAAQEERSKELLKNLPVLLLIGGASVVAFMLIFKQKK